MGIVLVHRHLTAALVASLLTLGTAGCAVTTDNEIVEAQPTCAMLEANVMDLIRLDAPSDDVSVALSALPKACYQEHDRIVAHLASLRTAAAVACGLDPETELWKLGLVEAASGGECSESLEGTQPGRVWPGGGLGWDQATSFVGSSERVCGPLVSLRNTEWGAFLNLGQDYPSPDRFAVVAWDVALEPIDPGSIICAEGEITQYEGVAQIEVISSSDIEIWSD